MTHHLITAATLAIALAACATQPSDLDLSLRHPTAQGRYVVQMDPPAAPPAINQIHAWQIKLSSPDGTPVRHARIAVENEVRHCQPRTARGRNACREAAGDIEVLEVGRQTHDRLAIRGNRNGAIDNSLNSGFVQDRQPFRRRQRK